MVWFFQVLNVFLNKTLLKVFAEKKNEKIL